MFKKDIDLLPFWNRNFIFIKQCPLKICLVIHDDQ